MRAGQVAPWRARRIAEQTLVLSFEAAGFVDQMVAPFAHKTGPAQTQRTVEEAIARFMPEHAAEQRDRAADGRYFAIDHDQVSFTGTSRVHGELDLADALDLEDAVAAGAAQLAALGSEDSLDVRRAAAVGMLARGQQPLDLQPLDLQTGALEPRTSVAKGREVVLYVHLSEAALRSHDPDAPVRLENAGGHLLTAGQVADWCGREDTAKVTVKPVIDLHQQHAVDQYKIPDWLAERVQLRDRTCVHPYCNRPARSCDLDHIVPWHDDGPPGQTSTDNLACLRLSHESRVCGVIGPMCGRNWCGREPALW